MFGYNARDGLCILEYLNLKDLTPEEERVFKQRWKEAYKVQKDPILTTKLLYVETLSFVCEDEKDMATITFNTRRSQFDTRLKNSGLGDKLLQRIPLRSILKKIPARV